MSCRTPSRIKMIISFHLPPHPPTSIPCNEPPIPLHEGSVYDETPSSLTSPTSPASSSLSFSKVPLPAKLFALDPPGLPLVGAICHAGIPFPALGANNLSAAADAELPFPIPFPLGPALALACRDWRSVFRDRSSDWRSAREDDWVAACFSII